MENIISYAGIGSETISSEEESQIKCLAKYLAKRGITLYSGNCKGADQAFQRGSGGECVIFLPWYSYELESYDVHNSIKYFVAVATKEGNESILKYHPRGSSIVGAAQKMHCRNYHIIAGMEDYPPVRFVLCCANYDSQFNVAGGTGQGVRIAKALSIPVYNIRAGFDADAFKTFVDHLE